MIRSMTGFGRGEFSDGKRNVIAEIKTVNHRYADISIKMPKRYSFAEEKLKAIIKNQVKRGKVDVSIIVENLTEGDITISLNKPVADQYIERLREEIVRVAGSFGVTLNDSQIRQLIDLFRSMEKLNPDELNERIEQAKETIERIGEAKDKAVGIYERLKSFLAPLSDFFEGLKELFG